ncbi:MAG: PAS domain S-box protein [Gammaproteobacteria bacterium]|nr:PAS domain S-box protein [Gammaproteobacteria bacterium]
MNPERVSTHRCDSHDNGLLSGPRPGIALASIALLPVLFGFDRYLPLGVAVGVLYVIPVLLTLWSPPRLTFVVACVASLLVVADVYLYPHDTMTWIAGLNRAFSLLVIWSTAALVYLRQRAERSVVVAHAELERKVDARTAHLAELNRHLEREVTERARAEQALQESERHLRRIIDLVPHRIFAKDSDGHFLLANRAVADVYGLTVEALIGRCMSDVHENREEAARMLADDRAVIESGVARLIPEETFTDVHGRCRTLRTLKIPYAIPGDSRRAVLGMAIDITEDKERQRRLIASEEKYRALLENAVDAILLANPDGRLVDANRRAELLLGYSKDELCRMSARDLHPPEEYARLQEVFRELANHGTTLVVHPVLRKGGEMIYCEVAAQLIRFGDQYVAQGIFRDVTERERLAEARLAQEKQHRDTLIREVHHRIKNNLQGVIGLLYRHVHAHPELEQTMASVVTQVQSISVVHGLQGQGEDTQVRLCDMVREITRNASVLARGEHAPDLQFAVPRPVIVDKEEAVAVALIVNELLLNALKHCHCELNISQVRIWVGQAGGVAEVRVTNPGCLPPGFDFAANKGCGTGLGLVRSLLPSTGAHLEIVQDAAEVRVSLRLTTPVVRC